MNEEANNPARHLNEAQWRRLVTTCRYIDKLLGEIELVLRAAESKSIFPRYVPDLPPAQKEALKHDIARLRAQILRAMGGQQGSAEVSRVEEAHAIHGLLTFVEIALEELRPKDMEDYGPLTEAGREDLRNIVRELTLTVREMQSGLSHECAELSAGEAAVLKNKSA